MTGPKTNEGATKAGERVGTRAQVRYARVSAYKAREVLDNIRGLDVMRADEVLQFTERAVAQVIRKCLASAVANAENNDNQSRDELIVAACYADEGPTLKRFRPRARGRAMRIRKRTCHITIVVARMSEQQLEVKRRREEAKPSRGARRGVQNAAASRRERVARSRRAAAGVEGDTEAPETIEATDTVDAVETAAAPTPGAYEGSVLPLEDGSAPEGYPIKGNEDSMLFHQPGGRHYKQTKAEVYFATVEAAEAAGFSAPGSNEADDADEASTEGEDA